MQSNRIDGWNNNGFCITNPSNNFRPSKPGSVWALCLCFILGMFSELKFVLKIVVRGCGFPALMVIESNVLLACDTLCYSLWLQYAEEF